jgi:uncharacterized protein YbjT (DUF2867 family)
MAGTVLVTGAAGREVLRRLFAEGVQVCAAAHTPAKAVPLERAGIATVTLDLDRATSGVPCSHVASAVPR